jgi:hypothetical protein
MFTGATVAGAFFFIGYFLGRYSARPKRKPLTVDGKRAR